MSPFGYSSQKQQRLAVSMDNLKSYIRDIENAVSEGILQKDSEFYSSIRFKSDVRKGESHLERLKTNGVSYIEFRSVDINPFFKTGISLAQMRFIHLFLIFCLFGSAGFLSDSERERIRKNDADVALEGLEEELLLEKKNGLLITLEDWAQELLEKMLPIAEILDHETRSRKYSQSLSMQFWKIRNKSLLPAGMILSEMMQKNEDYLEFGKRVGMPEKMKRNPKRFALGEIAGAAWERLGGCISCGKETSWCGC